MTDDRKQSLGEFFKAERIKREITIEQASSATKIGLKILKQLEADQYSELPALPFVRGFVRNYGKFLGLDGDKLLQEYSAFLEEHSRERPKRDAGHSGYAFERPEGEQSRKVLWGVMAGMLVFGGAVVFLFKPSLKRKHHAHVDKFKTHPGDDEESGEGSSPEASPSGLPSGLPSSIPTVPAVAVLPSPIVSPVLSPAPSPVAVATPSPSPKPKIAPIPSASPSIIPLAIPSPSVSASPALESVALTPEEDLKKDPLQTGLNYLPKEIRARVILRTKEDVWVRYRCDDKKIMKFALKKGKILVLRGKGAVFFQVSNPESITFQRGTSPEMLISESPDRFDYRGNTTLIWPTQDHEKIEEKFKVGAPLPIVAIPAPSPIPTP